MKNLFDLYHSVITAGKPNQLKQFKVKIGHPNKKEFIEVDGALVISLKP